MATVKRILTLLLLLGLLLSFFACKKAPADPSETTAGGNDEGDNSPEEYLLSEKETPARTEGTPLFSMPSGVYTDSFTVKITTDAEGASVRYTTDGSLPKKTSKEAKKELPVEYEKADEKDGGAVVRVFRAASFDAEGNQVGDTVSATYVMAPEGRFTTKVVTLTTDPTNLTGKKGLFTSPNYENRGRLWERPFDFKLIGYDGTLDVEQPLGLRINGTGTRSADQKNFRLFARREYSPEAGHLHYPLFRGMTSEYDGAEINEFDTFLLRGGASNLENTMITTQVTFELFKGTNVIPANFEPVSVFVNGEYYGLGSLIEDYGPYYFEEHFGTPEDLITTINFTVVAEGGWHLAWEFDDGPTTDEKEWEKVRSFISGSDMTKQDNYDKACKLLDMANFADYVITECYLDNWDWPRNNVRVWRYNGITDSQGVSGKKAGGYDPKAAYGFDGRWRFLAKDLDCSMSIWDSSRATDFFNVLEKDSGVPHDIDKMYASLIKNKNFKALFLSRISALMTGPLSPEHIGEVVSTLQVQIADEMIYQSARFKKTTLTTWDHWMSAMRTFGEERPSYVIEDLEQRFGLEIEKVTVGQFEHAKLYVGGNEIPSGGFFYAFRDNPQPYTVVPDPGYKLAKIDIASLSINDETVAIKIKPGKSPSMTPVIEEDGKEKKDEAKLCINEIGHSDREKVNGFDWVELYNPTGADISLKGMTLTNGIASYTFGQITVPAGGYKTILCGSDRKGGVYTGFSLSSEQTVSLLDAEGKKLDEIGIFPASGSCHVGRYPDGGELVSLTADEITPNAQNVHLTAFTHRFDERCYGAVLLDGVFFPKELVTADEKGRLYVTADGVSKLKDIPIGVPYTLKEAGYGKNDPIYLDELEKKVGKDKLRVFHSEELGSYLIWIAKEVE